MREPSPRSKKEPGSETRPSVFVSRFRFTGSLFNIPRFFFVSAAYSSVLYLHSLYADPDPALITKADSGPLPDPNPGLVRKKVSRVNNKFQII
jgi:hypothetical protein